MRILHILALGRAGGIESLCVDIAKYSREQNYFYFLWGGGENAEKICALTDKVEIRNFSMKKLLSEYRNFERYCLDNQIEVIMVQGSSPMMLFFADRYKKKYSEVKIVLYLHSSASHLFLNNWKQRIAFQYVYKNADGVIAISEFVKNSVKNLIADDEKIKVIYNGVDTDKFAFAERQQGNKPAQLIYVGRLIPEKGLNLLLEALAHIKQDEWRLRIIGEGPEKEPLEKMACRLGMEGQVSFEGVQWNVADWLASSDIFVHPVVCEEGFGLTLVEAMASGIPCIAYRKGGIPEVIEDGADGFLVDDVSAQALEETINRVLIFRKTDREGWNKICLKARKKAMKFGIGRYMGELSAYYREI